MTEREKLVTEKLQEIKSKINECFGCKDNIFVSHEMDENIANEILEIANKNRIHLNDIVKIAVEYLECKKCPEEHITEQTKKIKDFYKSL